MTADEVGDPTTLELTTHINGVLRQQAKISDLIFDIPTLIETLSQTITLLPGDIIATGTPAGGWDRIHAANLLAAWLCNAGGDHGPWRP